MAGPAQSEVTAEPGSLAGLDALLGRLGLGSVRDTHDLGAFPGRNDIWAGTTESGHHVFVKRFTGSPGDSLSRFRRSVAFERLAVAAGVAGLTAPRCLGWDEQARLLASELIEGARSGAELAAQGEFGPGLACRAGAAIAGLHSLRAAAPDRGSRPSLPSLELLAGLPLPVFAECSGAELQAWHLMQHDEPLVAAIGDLLSQERKAPWVPAHCDLRLDQFLVDGQKLWVSDWEEFRLADPARDIGSFTGELLHRAVFEVAGPGAEAAGPAGDWLSHEQIIRRCAGAIERAAVTVAAFAVGYRRVRPCLDAWTLRRAAAFAGWHLLDRMTAAAKRSARLGALDRAAGGIGRAILLAPGESVVTVGLGGEP